MADGPFNPNTRAPSLQLLNLPSEILGLVFQQITDLDSLLACRQTCSHLYEIYDSNRAPCNTRATLDALTKRGIECRQPCLFAQVVMKDDRPPSMYLEPALLALRHGRSDLCQRFCRALLGLRYFVGYDEDAQYAPGRSGWTYREVTDRKAIQRQRHPGDSINHHLVILGQMSDYDVGIVREVMCLEEV